MASATEWRIEKPAKGESVWKARTRLRAPYRVLRGIFGSDGDMIPPGLALESKVTTAWHLKKASGTTLVVVHDRQSDENRKFSLDNFRARLQYDWHVGAKDEAGLKDFCTWISKEIIRRVEAEPQPKRLTAAAKEKVNALVGKGVSVADAMKQAAEWEIIVPAAEAYRWPIQGDSKEL